MSITKEFLPIPEEVDSLPLSSRSGNSVTVYMEDSLGAIFLGFLSGILLVGWMRAEARNRALLMKLEQANGYHLPDA